MYIIDNNSIVTVERHNPRPFQPGQNPRINRRKNNLVANMSFFPVIPYIYILTCFFDGLIGLGVKNEIYSVSTLLNFFFFPTTKTNLGIAITPSHILWTILFFFSSTQKHFFHLPKSNLEITTTPLHTVDIIMCPPNVGYDRRWKGGGGYSLCMAAVASLLRRDGARRVFTNQADIACTKREAP